MKILLDEMLTGMKEFLELLEWQVLTVETINMKSAEDLELVKYASENDLLIITKDKKLKKLAELKSIPCICIDDQLLAKMVNDEIKRKKF